MTGDPIRAAGLSRKADLLMRQKNWNEAETLYKQAVALSGFKPAKKKLKKLERWRKEGRIPS